MPIHRLAEYFRHSLGEPFERAKAPHTARMSAGCARARPGHRPPLTEEDTHLHAWLNERLAVLH